jgi:maleylacetate reductase
MIVRWGLEQLAPTLAELGVERVLLVSTERWRGLELPVVERFHGVKPHAERTGVEGALALAREAEIDGLVALGGGSAIDSGKAVSAETGLPLVSVPTTYSGAEWTPYFGVRDEARGVKGGGSGANLAAAIYEPKLTLDLPRGETGGTALNALAHCAEALYVDAHNVEGDREAREGATLINSALPAVLEDGSELGPRTTLLTGAMHAGAALASAGLGLGHAMAQALGGRYGLPHGALNAICLPPALRFNEPVAADAIESFGDAMGTADPVRRVEHLARLAGFTRLRELGVPAEELNEVAEATAVRAGAKANPRPAAPAEIAELLRSVW